MHLGDVNFSVKRLSGRGEPMKRVTRAIVCLAAVLITAQATGASAATAKVKFFVREDLNTSALFGISCATSAASCIAVGVFSNPGDTTPGFGNLIVQTVQNGVPTGGTIVPEQFGGVLNSVSCWTPGTCIAVGTVLVAQSPPQTEGLVVPITNGGTGNPVTLSDVSSLTGITCTSGAMCMATGEDGINGGGSSEGVVVPIVAGTPGSAEPVQNTRILNAISCVATTDCTAVGQMMARGDRLRGVVVSIANGVPGTSLEASATETLKAVQCQNPSSCTAVGSHLAGSVFKDALVKLEDGKVVSRALFPKHGVLDGYACGPSNGCIAVGTSSQGEGTFVVGSRVTMVPATQTLYAASCFATCVAVGVFPRNGSNTVGVDAAELP